MAEATQNIPHPFPPGAAEAFVARAMTHERPGSVWVMDGALTGLSEVLGVISLKPMEVKPGQGGQSEVAYWVAPAFWNTGIASEAVRALVAANPLADRTYFAEVFQDNPGSARVLTNAGFQYLGDAEAFSVARGAHGADLDLYPQDGLKVDVLHPQPAVGFALRPLVLTGGGRQGALPQDRTGDWEVARMADDRAIARAGRLRTPAAVLVPFPSRMMRMISGMCGDPMRDMGLIDVGQG